jgi:iron complex transport system ATP-binding protein
MIALRSAAMRYGARWLFRDLDLAVPRGRILAILGPNGRGKTTLLRCILGTVRLLDGSRTAPPILGYVPQSTTLGEGYSAIEVTLMGRGGQLGLFGQPTAADRALAMQCLAEVGAAHLAGARMGRLSGGERQLVLMARALATGSPALLLDEPGSALDLRNQSRLLGLLRALGARGDKAIVFTTHEPNHALAAADDALLMLPDGETLFGPVEEIVTPVMLERLYGVPMLSIAADGTARGVAVAPLFR